MLYVKTIESYQTANVELECPACGLWSTHYGNFPKKCRVCRFQYPKLEDLISTLEEREKFYFFGDEKSEIEL